MTCNSSSSNISGTPIAGEVTQVGSQLKVDVVQVGHGFTAGNVIRFDVDSNGYTLAQADSPANAEVCGVVADGTIEAEARLERVLTYDPGMGIMRHADAGYEQAIDNAKKFSIKIPMFK